MGTKTVDEAADEQAADLTKTDASDDVTETETETDTDDDAILEDGLDAGPDAGPDDAVAKEGATGVGQGAGAVVAAVLGFVSLSGSWIGTIAGARQTLVGQLQTSSSASVAHQIQAVYGDAWQATALWAGLFALTALVVGVVVLARPAFGNAGPQAPWIKSVSWAGVVLGVVGLLLAVLKYTDALLGLPSAS
ncbi:hypothetical protein ACH4U3_25570 [Streptomyces griseoruber]|uniref:hypothetical protein n=1 Tax=Streptomyces griseoruber TaxID=1943 RepID=UPI0037990F2A